MAPSKVFGVKVKRGKKKAVIRWKGAIGATAYRVKVGKKTATVNKAQIHGEEAEAEEQGEGEDHCRQQRRIVPDGDGEDQAEALTANRRNG